MTLAPSTDTDRGTLRFFALAFGITWSLQLPALLVVQGVLAGPIDRFMPLMGLGAFGPLLAALLVSRRRAGGAGVRALLGQPGVWRVGPLWYVAALALPAVILAAGMAAATLVGVSGAWFYLPTSGERIAALIVFPIGEEVGWRGLAQPRLQQRHGALAGSLLLGVAWGLWHIPMFLIAGGTPGVFAMSMVYLLAGSVMFGWVYNHTRGSLVIAILLHMGAHLANVNLALPDVTPLVVYTISLSVFAAALVLVDRRIWRAAPG